MASRIGFTLETRRRWEPSTSESDALLVWKDGDDGNLGILYDGHVMNLPSLNPREMRSIAMQLLQHSKRLAGENPKTEVVA